MIRAMLGAAIALFLVSCAGPGGERAIQEPQSQDGRAEVSPTEANAEEGRRLAEIYCSTCHAIGPTGESRHPTAPPLRTLSRDYPLNSLEEAFAEGILVGHPEMPEFRFTPAEIDHLVAYLNSIQSRRVG